MSMIGGYIPMNNKKIGNSFEEELCNLLSQNGFWAYNAINKASGQPADVMASRNNTSYLIDCKVCSKDEFPLSRIEENQYNAMMLFNKCGNKETYFALKFSDDSVYMVHSIPLFIALNNGVKTIRKSDIKWDCFGNLFSEWVEKQKCYYP